MLWHEPRKTWGVSSSNVSRLSVALSFSFVLCGALAACSSDDKTPPPSAVSGGTINGGGVGAGGGGTSDASTADSSTTVDSGTTTDAGTDAGASCLPGATFALDGGFGGTLAVRGTFNLPATLQAARIVVVSVASAAGGESHDQSFAATAASDRFSYRIGGLVKGSYVIRVRADANGNGLVTDSGDYDGYYDGSAVAPILTRADAKVVTLDTTCLDALNFGAGIRP